MKLVSAKCPNCGANLKLDSEKTSIECEYCKQTIVVQEAVERYKLDLSGTVSVDGITSNSDLISAANELLEMKEYLKAKRKFLEFSEKCPNDYQGWLGLLICRTRNFTIRDNNVLFENEVNNYYEHFLKTAPEEIKEKYKVEMDGFFANEQKDDNIPNNTVKKEKSNKKTWLWVLGWIFCFPIPLSILIIWRTKWPTAVRTIVIILLWCVIFAIGSSNSNKDTSNTANNINVTSNVVTNN